MTKVEDILIADRTGHERYGFVRQNTENSSVVDSVTVGVYYRDDGDYVLETNESGQVHGVDDLAEDAEHYIDLLLSRSFIFAIESFS